MRSRHSGACFTYVAGSIAKGQGTRLSDIDIVVVCGGTYRRVSSWRALTPAALNALRCEITDAVDDL